VAHVAGGARRWWGRRGRLGFVNFKRPSIINRLYIQNMNIINYISRVLKIIYIVNYPIITVYPFTPLKQHEPRLHQAPVLGVGWAAQQRIIALAASSSEAKHPMYRHLVCAS
jgi:hypothetical protein